MIRIVGSILDEGEAVPDVPEIIANRRILAWRQVLDHRLHVVPIEFDASSAGEPLLRATNHALGVFNVSFHQPSTLELPSILAFRRVLLDISIAAHPRRRARELLDQIERGGDSDGT